MAYDIMILIGIMTYDDTNHIGPSDSLVIFGMRVNTNQKYIGVIVLCIVNSAVRVMNTNIIHAWVINNSRIPKYISK